MFVKVCLIFSLVFFYISESTKEKSSNLDIETQWQLFKNQYRTGQNSYKSVTEEKFRHTIFVENYLKIVKHNFETDFGLHADRLGVNQFTDQTDEELYSTYTINFSTLPPLPKEIKSFSQMDTDPIDPNRILPKYFDWREKYVLTHVKDQGQCSSCWVFSTVAALESHLAMKTGKLNALSDQQVIDCTPNYTCKNGNFMETALQTVKALGGIETNEKYPYVNGKIGKVGNCLKLDKPNRFFADNLKVVNVASNALHMQIALLDYGPLVVYIHVYANFFKYNSSTIYESVDCNQPINHAVTIVGFGEENGKPYWIVRNSWGAKWCDKGYIKILRGSNMCRIESTPKYISS
ncbi:procathepsin L-like [Oppia nitens]|uniref:procathepsin L-like n=1 Tax=Oppia nitens TaxID=1686743 RepID=UPI0023DACC11|nr:procathepsin L-like [Oppia nitens]